MEASNILGTSGSESSWTRYIASSIQEQSNHDHDGDDGDVDDNQGIAKKYGNEDDGESDDSMTSDASSGPSHHGWLLPCRGSSKGGLGMDTSKYASATTKHARKQKMDMKVKQRDGRRSRVEKGESLIMAKSAASGNKVRKLK